jgi:hypothetical protein
MTHSPANTIKAINHELAFHIEMRFFKLPFLEELFIFISPVFTPSLPRGSNSRRVNGFSRTRFIAQTVRRASAKPVNGFNPSFGKKFPAGASMWMLLQRRANCCAQSF